MNWLAMSPPMSDPTPEEAVKHILGLATEWDYKPGCPCDRCHEEDIRAAVATETERCAKIAEVYIHNTPQDESERDALDHTAAYSNSTCVLIAAAIRRYVVVEPADD